MIRLIGPGGAGKSTAGALLAQPLGVVFVDLDAAFIAQAGDIDKALELLEHAVDYGMYPYKFYAEYCPFIALLRGHPEFERIVAKAARRVAAFSG